MYDYYASVCSCREMQLVGMKCYHHLAQVHSVIFLYHRKWISDSRFKRAFSVIIYLLGTMPLILHLIVI